MTIRQPIITFVGHIDHGKTSLQDYIRQSAVAKTESGLITQHIGCSNIPIETIRKICGRLLETLKLKLTIPGLLFIDTPGHAAFTNLRKRGGNLADIAVLVVDINEGIMPQTMECIDILRGYKTPFIIALNKIDLIQGWQSKNAFLIEAIDLQFGNAKQSLDNKLYHLVGKLAELNFNAERFDRVSDYTKEIAIVPTSAKTGDGIPELLMVLTGLAQKFLGQNLEVDVEVNAKGTILEVKEEKGLGRALDVVIYDGTLRQNDIMVIGTLSGPIITKAKALLLPSSDTRNKKTKFKNIERVSAAIGVKVLAPDLEKAVAGMPLRACPANETEKVKNEIKKEVEGILIETDKQGIIIKADSLGSLEALIKLFREKKIEVKRASIGNISKKDVSDAQATYEKNPLQGAVLGFNVELMPEVHAHKNVKVFTNSIIYKLIEDFEKWQNAEKKRIREKDMQFIIMPCKIQIMKGYVFRQNNPAVVGVDILAGTLKVGAQLMKSDSIAITEVKSIQQEQESINKADKGRQVAISLPKVTVGRQLQEGDILYSVVPEDDFRKLKEFKGNLTKEETEILREIAEIMRSRNPVWGI